MVRSLILAWSCLAVCATAQQSMLLDDFMNGDGRNRLGLEWYYFSDENDNGNSAILNTTGKSGGGYSGVVYDTVEDATNRCVRLDFVLGDPNEVWFSNSFVGIGTDIAPPGSTVDLRGLGAVRFRVRSVPEMAFTFEIISEVTPNFTDYCRPYKAGPDWKEYQVSVRELAQPDWVSKSSLVKLDSVLAKVRKFNWKVFSNDNCYDCESAEGSLQLDIVFMEGEGTFWEQQRTGIRGPAALAVRQTEPCQRLPRLFDILGRNVSRRSGNLPSSPGAVIHNFPAGNEVRISY